ncbi:MAG: saccharopine dehydrogenase NADP-binding domain-containing protein [Pirellulales bacterium]|nr:saccharopine dehydrogenase NADP-binding domain-containing protein [Pirellulales bacterium]
MGRPAWMIYGANGYTGRWITREAIARGMHPILAGRNRRAVEALAAELDCPARAFRLTTTEGIAEHLMALSAVLHCAGPFSTTGEPMMDACLAAGTHYLDITGEIDVIEAAAARHDRATRARISLIPAVGFDVVPSDCLAAMLARRMPDATSLQLAFTGLTRVSRGTARTVLEGLPRGGRVRIDGQVTTVPVAWKSMEIPFRGGPRAAMTVPWGDVSSAWHTTGIPNIEVYMAVPGRLIERVRGMRWALRLLGFWPVKAFLRHVVLRRPGGPSPEASQADRASFWGRVSNRQGDAVEATLETPGGYRLTVATALASLGRVLDRDTYPGFYTPATAFGADFILDLPEVEFAWKNE